MNTKNDDNEPATKGYIRDVMESRFSHHFGMMMEYFEHKFSLILEGYADVPDKVLILRDKAQENEYEHKEFKLRIRNLEGKA